MIEIEGAGHAVLAGRLREHRERLKLTQSDLSGRSGIGVSSVSEFENGKREPTISQLKQLAVALETDLGALLSSQAPSSVGVRWRQRPVEAELMEARLLRLCRQYRDLEQWAGEEEPVRLRRVDRFPANRTEVAALATQIRAELQLGDRPGLGLLRRLEDDYAVKTFQLAFEPKGSAACTGDPELGPAVLLNANNSIARRTFDLAHELFHLLTWGVPIPAGVRPMEETFADQFAAALLLPEGALRQAVGRRVKDGRLSIANICELARDFGISIDALIWRMHNIYGWGDAEKAEALIAKVRGMSDKYRAVADQDKETTPELPERYRMLAVQALRSGEISIGRFAEYMGLRRWEAMKYADEASGDETVSLPGL